MTPTSRTLNAMAYKARSRKKKDPWKVEKDNSYYDYANDEFASCKDFVIKRS